MSCELFMWFDPVTLFPIWSQRLSGWRECLAFKNRRRFLTSLLLLYINTTHLGQQQEVTGRDRHLDGNTQTPIRPQVAGYSLPGSRRALNALLTLIKCSLDIDSSCQRQRKSKNWRLIPTRCSHSLAKVTWRKMKMHGRCSRRGHNFEFTQYIRQIMLTSYNLILQVAIYIVNDCIRFSQKRKLYNVFHGRTV